MSGEKRALWGVRGISNELANQVAAAAKGKGMMLGEWVTRALEAALEREADQQQQADGGELRARIRHLEAEVRRLDKESQAKFNDVLSRLIALEPKPAATNASDADPKEWHGGW